MPRAATRGRESRTTGLLAAPRDDRLPRLPGASLADRGASPAAFGRRGRRGGRFDIRHHIAKLEDIYETFPQAAASTARLRPRISIERCSPRRGWQSRALGKKTATRLPASLTAGCRVSWLRAARESSGRRFPFSAITRFARSSAGRPAIPAHNGYRTLSGDELLAMLRGERAQVARSRAHLRRRRRKLLRRRVSVAAAMGSARDLLRRSWNAFRRTSRGVPARCGSADDVERAARDTRCRPHRHRIPHAREPAHSHVAQPRSLDGVERSSRPHCAPRRCRSEEDFREPRLSSKRNCRERSYATSHSPRYDGTAEAIAAAKRCGYEACHWGIIPGQPVNSARHLAVQDQPLQL